MMPILSGIYLASIFHLCIFIISLYSGQLQLPILWYLQSSRGQTFEDAWDGLSWLDFNKVRRLAPSGWSQELQKDHLKSWKTINKKFCNLDKQINSCIYTPYEAYIYHKEAERLTRILTIHETILII